MIHKEIDFNIGITNSSVLCPLSRYRNNGIINNLPDEPPAGTPDPAKAAREAADTAARSSVLEKLREKERARPPRPPRPFMPDREERSLE